FALVPLLWLTSRKDLMGGWVNRRVTTLTGSVVAALIIGLNGYRVAATRMTATRPGCGLDWSLLAGIGRVESNHGRYGGAVLNDDGTSTPQIIGPPLDGVQFAFISDSDGGQWDGDRSYDRAVGPMQFIPGTWRSYGVDGDGDGDEQPTDIDDAALAAASYLCVAGGDLTTDAGRRRALLAYNHSDSYVDQVLALAAAYAAGIPVADLPLVGDTTSPVPAPSGAGSGPAAPGPAIGAGDSTPSRPGQPTVLPGQPAPAAAGSEPQPAGAPAGEPPASGGGGTGAGSGSGSGTGSGAGSGPGAGSGGGSGSSAGGQQVPPAPAPPSAPALPPAPQPVPVPLPLPTIDVPVPAPLPVPLPICLPNVLPSLQQGCVPG
ncbi:lytic murein transglycosylase, partial [Modestobacter versicolor]|uniref:lytic murein transglycosylase n=1 Tax=Modestobacter versicolor TaxID=429133 RepID=UPI001C65427A